MIGWSERAVRERMGDPADVTEHSTGRTTIRYRVGGRFLVLKLRDGVVEDQR